MTLINVRIEGDSVLLGSQEVAGGTVVSGRGIVREQRPDTIEFRIPFTELYQTEGRFSGGRTLLAVGGLVVILPALLMACCFTLHD